MTPSERRRDPAHGGLLAVAAALLLAVAPGTRAACIPLPSADLQALDRGDGDPEGSVAAAAARLQALAAPADALRTAELEAVIAEARANQDRLEEAHAAASAANRALASLPRSAAADRVRWRVALSEIGSNGLRPELERSLAAADALLAVVPRDSIERSCVLSRRAAARGALGTLDLAAADGIAAYRIAETGGWPEPRVIAAYELATIYRRAGLLAAAERMIDELVTFTSAEGRTMFLSTAVYVRGQILSEAHRYAEARAEFEQAAAIAARIGDAAGVGFIDIALCAALAGERNWDAAERACAAGDAQLRSAPRPDLLPSLVGSRASIDLARHRPAAALARLDAVLGEHAAQLRPRTLPPLYRARAAALGDLGRYREAYDDLQHATEVENALEVEQRATAVAVLNATTNAERLLASNRTLEERMARQREDLRRRELTQRLWIALAVAALLLSLLFGYLLSTTRRQERLLQRQELVLRTASSYAPDALMLLDGRRQVRFANRNLFGTGPLPVAGQPLAASVPAAALPVVEAAVGELFEERRPVTFATSLVDAAGETRHFELRGVPVIVAGELVGATLRAIDVTEVRGLEREVIDVASRERHRLSSDLHEGLGQELTGVSLLLRSLMTAIERGLPNTRALVGEVTEHVARAIDTTRELARGLSPVQIERGSLSAALDRLADEAGQRLRIRITSRSEPAEIAVPDVTADHLYRIGYEAITNAARHSGCRSVDLRLAADGGQLRLTITDDGGGVGAAAGNQDGLGLKMMAYRARLLGGSFRIEPAPRGGTRVVVAVPLDPPGRA